MASIRDATQELMSVSWSLLAQETAKDTLLHILLRRLQEGHSIDASEDLSIARYKPIYESIYEHEGVLMYEDRVIVPSSLRRKLLVKLHAAHQGTSTMEQRTRQIVYWPGMSNDIRTMRDQCSDCNRNAPSQAATPPIPSSPPATPFEEVFADFFDYGGHHYLVIGDRLSGWVEVLSSTSGTNLAGSAELIRHLRSFFSTFGVPNELSSDGGPEFMASSTQDFFLRWNIRHRVSSAYFPQSNGRAEVAVKTAKRLLVSNTGPTGSLDNDRFLRAMLQLQNTPDPDCNISPAQIIFGRPLRDTLPFISKLEKFSNPHVRPIWRQAWAAKEDALRVRIARHTESLTAHSRPLRPPKVGAKVFIRNQQGASQNKWDKSGTVVESLPHDQYRIRVDGSGRLTLRNRRFLRAFSPSTSSLSPQPIAVPLPPQIGDQHPSLPDHQEDHTLLLSPSPLDSDSNLSANDPPTLETQPPVADLGSDQPDKGTECDAAVLAPDGLDSQMPSPPPRPKRTRRPPRRYEPETGQWIAG